MNIGSFFVADSQATKLIQPGKGSLHHPSPATKAAAISVLRIARRGTIPRTRSPWRIDCAS